MELSLAYSADGMWTSPLPLPKGEDEGEGLFFCDNVNVIGNTSDVHEFGAEVAANCR